jgi:hypothetical protein
VVKIEEEDDPFAEILGEYGLKEEKVENVEEVVPTPSMQELTPQVPS